MLATIGDPLDSQNPRTILCKELETELKQFAVCNAELFNALEELHSAVEDDSGNLNLALSQARRLIEETRGRFPKVRELTLHTDNVNRILVDMAGVKTQPNEKILFRETSY
jgi:hypothetical protein